MSAPPTPSHVAPPLSMYNTHNNALNGSNHSSSSPMQPGLYNTHNNALNGSNHSSSSPMQPGLHNTHNNALNGSNHSSSSPMQPGLNHPSAQTISGQHRGHGPDRREVMQPHQKVASSRAILMKTRQSEASYLSPVPHRASVRHSLVGFDPLLSDATAAATPSRRPINMGVSPSQFNSLPPPPQSSQARTLQSKQGLTPTAQTTTKDKAQHRKGVHSFCTSDLRSISQDAAEDTNESLKEECEKRSNSSGSRGSSPTPETAPRQSPPAQGKKLAQPRVSLGLRSNSSSPKPNKITSKKDTLSGSDNENETPKEEKRSSLTPPRSRKLPWPKKGHRRTRSLESQENMSVLQQAVGDSRPSSIPNSVPNSERKSSMYPSLVKDLMDLKFNILQIPSLAKPSPTSFLIGKEDEVVRTCEQEPAPHQIEIPTLPEFVVTARLNEFVENYRRVDQNFDLQQWIGLNRMDLRQVKIPEHVPIAHSLLECGEEISLQGFITKGTDVDERLEAVVFEGQREFIVVFRGTTEQQAKAGSKSKKKAVPLDKEHETVEVYQCFLEEYMKLEPECFALLDKLTEEHPFCDVVFSGHSFGAAMATLAAFRYANARPMMRASCLTLASPKVGFSLFRHMVNSLPNLRVMRMEFGQDGKCQLPGVGGSHVGHTLVLKGSLGSNALKPNRPVLAYKFDTPKHKKFKTTYPDLRTYVTALEEIARLGLPWAEDFVGTSGQGVVVNNEARQVV